MNIAIILSGGSGTRIGAGMPKQYLVTNGRSMIERAMEPFIFHPDIDGVLVAAENAWYDRITEDVVRLANDRHFTGLYALTTEEIRARMLGFSQPGTTRAGSIYNALRALSRTIAENDVVIIHDAARPFVSGELITRLVEACKTHDGAIPVLPMKDTVYMLPNGMRADAPVNEPDRLIPMELLPRERIAAGQAPEAFRYGKYLAANEALLPDKLARVNGSTEVALLAGMDIAVVEGEESNFKVTTQTDLDRYQLELSVGGRY